MKDNLQSLPNVAEVRDLAQLQAQMQRPAKNVNMDGSFELGWGTGLLCFGSVAYLNAVLPTVLPKWVWTSWWTAWIGFLPLICAGFAPYGIPRMIKRFITWPRTGYVANPNDVKLSQLVMLMGFGGALGFSLTLPFILVSEIREAISRPGARSDLQSIIWHGIELLVCATVAVYLGRKTIRKRQPLPVAYDSALINQGLRQTAAGRKTLRVVKSTLLVMFVGVPILACGVVFGLTYLSKSAMRHTEIHWPQFGVLSFVVAANALLYLMGNAVAIKQHRWKWLGLALLLIAPLVAAPAIPYPAVNPELMPTLELFPPQAMLVMGLVWFLSGAATLISFMRHNPLLPAETA
jgi:hypothetical protein